MQDELSGTENATNVIFLHTTVDDGDHFQPECFRGTLKSRWQSRTNYCAKLLGLFAATNESHFLRAQSYWGRKDQIERLSLMR
jgi:hypothetical protein